MESFDLIVLGGGSGGLAAAKRAASHGARVALVEGDRLGGTCVIRGCVPKKLLVYGSMYGEYIKNSSGFGIQFTEVDIKTNILLSNVRREVDRLNQLYINSLSDSGVKLVKGYGRFLNKNLIEVDNKGVVNEKKELYGDRILIAVGGRPVRPAIPGSSLGWVSDDIFTQKVFPKSIIIIGGGFIACEFASILNGLGVEVKQLVRGDHLLRNFDHECSALLERSMKEKGIDLIFGTTLNKIERDTGNLKLTTVNGIKYSSEAVLFAIGREPNTHNLSLSKAGIVHSKGKVIVNEQCQTNIENIYSVGDVSNNYNLTPVAIEEGRAFSDSIYGNESRNVNYQLVPKAVFSQPEIATVGLTEEEAIHKYGVENIRIFRSSFRPMSQSLANYRSHCLLKLITIGDSGKIKGCHMVGEHAAEIIQMASIALSMGATKRDFDQTMALHPTISEEFVTMT